MSTRKSGEGRRPGNNEANDLPPPLTEEPPPDRYCDLILNGGVASGVVYPWALLKLARFYRFRRLGGNSVGAMAACVAAAAEYGRCNGVAHAFEPLRQMPVNLAVTEPETGRRQRTQMLRLFQPSPSVARPFELFLAITNLMDPPAEEGRRPDAQDHDASHSRLPIVGAARAALTAYLWKSGLAKLLAVVAIGVPLVAIGIAVSTRNWGCVAGLAVVEFVLLALVVGLAIRTVLCDVRAIAANGFGLCTGKSQQAGKEALLEWMHEGIQRSAGRCPEDPPLTFADLWAAPRPGLAAARAVAGVVPPDQRGIDLQMFCTNITLGRPVRLPLEGQDATLYFDPPAWAKIFPAAVLKALRRASTRYRPKSPSDPDPVLIRRRLAELDAKRERDDDEQADWEELKRQCKLLRRLRELPSADMPIVVAARLSLSFPLLFTTVPVYAVDYEAPRGLRLLRQCLTTDGGLCSNFPVHLFDAAQPRWPTFALRLDKRLPAYLREKVWLPRRNAEGRGGSWQRGVPGVYPSDRALGLSAFFRLVGGMISTMKDWNDNLTVQLPQVRTRVVRIALKPGEGQLNIGMDAKTILKMAHEYGDMSGALLVRRFAPCKGIKPAWRDHLYVRMQVELRSLRSHLQGYTAAVHTGGSTTMTLPLLLDEATRTPPLFTTPGRPDPGAAVLTIAERDALMRTVRAIEALEQEIAATDALWGPYRPLPKPELRLRPPL